MNGETTGNEDPYTSEVPREEYPANASQEAQIASRGISQAISGESALPEGTFVFHKKGLPDLPDSFAETVLNEIKARKGQIYIGAIVRTVFEQRTVNPRVFKQIKRAMRQLCAEEGPLVDLENTLYRAKSLEELPNEIVVIKDKKDEERARSSSASYRDAERELEEKLRKLPKQPTRVPGQPRPRLNDNVRRKKRRRR